VVLGVDDTYVYFQHPFIRMSKAFALITLIFYFHPSTKAAVSFYRTVPILSEGVSRV